MKKSLLVALSILAAGGAMTAATPAFARVNWSVNVGVGGYGYYPGPVYGPRYYAPPPVVYAPPPVYVQPYQPVYQQPYYPPPVYVQPQVVRPVQYAPPVYIQRPQQPQYDPRYVPPDYQGGGYQRSYREYPDYGR